MLAHSHIEGTCVDVELLSQFSMKCGISKPTLNINNARAPQINIAWQILSPHLLLKCSSSPPSQAQQNAMQTQQKYSKQKNCALPTKTPVQENPSAIIAGVYISHLLAAKVLFFTFSLSPLASMYDVTCTTNANSPIVAMDLPLTGALNIVEIPRHAAAPSLAMKNDRYTQLPTIKMELAVIISAFLPNFSLFSFSERHFVSEILAKCLTLSKIDTTIDTHAP